MRKAVLFSLLLVLTLCFLSGCTQKKQSKTAENIKTDSEVKIVMCPNKSYINYSKGSMGDSFKVEGSPVVLRGEGPLIIGLTFDENVNMQSVKRAVNIKGYNGEVVFNPSPLNKKNMHIYLNKIENGKKYTLEIGKNISFLNGRKLENPINIDFTLEKDTWAVYSLIGDDEKFNYMGIYELEKKGSQLYYLTNSPKHIIADFTRNVDKISVEKSILDGAANSGISPVLRWINDKRLDIKIENFNKGINTVKLRMNNAMDKDCFNIIGEFGFLIGEKNSVFSISNDGSDKKLIRIFNDRRYMPLPSKYIEDNCIFFDGYHGGVFNILNGNITTVAKYKMDEIYPYTKDDILVLDNNNILKYSVDDGFEKEFIKLNEELLVLKVFVSPDKSRIAAAIQNKENAKASIYIYSSEGELISSFKNIGIFKSDKFGVHPVICWYDNDSLIYDICKNKNEDYSKCSIYSLNIKTGKIKKLYKGAYNPNTKPGCDVIKYTTKDDEKIVTHIIKNGKKALEFKSNEYSNFKILDSESIAFNKGKEIIIFNIDNKTQTSLGEGYIFGASPDDGSIYYMTNYNVLYNAFPYSDSYSIMEIFE